MLYCIYIVWWHAVRSYGRYVLWKYFLFFFKNNVIRNCIWNIENFHIYHGSRVGYGSAFPRCGSGSRSKWYRSTTLQKIVLQENIMFTIISFLLYESELNYICENNMYIVMLWFFFNTRIYSNWVNWVNLVFEYVAHV